MNNIIYFVIRDGIPGLPNYFTQSLIVPNEPRAQLLQNILYSVANRLSWRQIRRESWPEYRCYPPSAICAIVAFALCPGPLSCCYLSPEDPDRYRQFQTTGKVCSIYDFAMIVSHSLSQNKPGSLLYFPLIQPQNIQPIFRYYWWVIHSSKHSSDEPLSHVQNCLR